MGANAAATNTPAQLVATRARKRSSFEYALHPGPPTPQPSLLSTGAAGIFKDQEMSRLSAHQPSSQSGAAGFGGHLLRPPRIDTTMAKDYSLRVGLPTPDEPLAPASANAYSSRTASDSQSPTTQSAGLLGPKFPTPALPAADDADGFTPHFMDMAEPKAQELLRSRPTLRRETRGSDAGSQSTASMTASVTAVDDTRGPAAANGDDAADRQGGSPTPGLLRRSISMLLRRSTSSAHRSNTTLRRKNPNSNSSRSSPSSNSGSRCASEESQRSDESLTAADELYIRPPATTSGIRTPTRAPALPPSDLALALTTSQFNTASVNGMISSLVGNSMVHVKVVMDADSTVVIPMARTLVFARARDRILTKLYQGGIPLVEAKRRKLVLCKPDGGMVTIEDNPTWRSVMDAVSCAKRRRVKEAVAKTANRVGQSRESDETGGQSSADEDMEVAAGEQQDRANFKMVEKLTLYLADPKEIAERQAGVSSGGLLGPLPAPVSELSPLMIPAAP